MAAYLFTVEDGVVKPHAETLLISPYAEIWDRDEEPGHFNALNEFRYIEFLVSQKKTNPYKGYEESVRHEKIVKDTFLNQDWQPDELVQMGVEKLKEFQKESSITLRHYESAIIGVEKVNKFFREVDMTEKNERSGLPVWKPKDITSAVKDTDDLLTKLDKMKEKVEAELFDKVINRGGREHSPFSDPENEK